MTGPGVFIGFNVFGNHGTDTANCPAGKKVVGGGYTTNPIKGTAQVNYPVSATSWTVTLFVNATEGSTTLTAYAVCVFAP